MPQNFPDLQELFDSDGRPLGALLGAGAWAQVREAVLAGLGCSPASPEVSEPLADWHSLIELWDFKYPVDLDVACPLCGNASQDWERDEPRRFRLTAANLGGLVSFRCLSCQAKVIKRHFFDEITVQALPFAAERCTRNTGRGS